MEVFHFLRLPIEIRLEVYALLLCAKPSRILQIRTASSRTYHKLKSISTQRNTYLYIADRLRSRSAESTYHLLPNWGLPRETIHTAILLTNRQINEEATRELYASHTFDFGLDIECIVPFLSDLTSRTRDSLRSISLTKRALPYTKDFDRSEWKAACAYIATNLSHILINLQLNVYGGCPASGYFANQQRTVTEGAADEVRPFTKEVFVHLAMWEEMEWARQLTAVKGLRTVIVEAIIEHCPLPESRAMAFYVKFSRSIEAGFKHWLSGIMVQMEDNMIAATNLGLKGHHRKPIALRNAALFRNTNPATKGTISFNVLNAMYTSSNALNDRSMSWKQAGTPSKTAYSERSRLKEVKLDPLEAIGLPSKGDNRLLDFRTQEDYFTTIHDRYEKLQNANCQDQFPPDDALASLSIYDSSEVRTAAGSGSFQRALPETKLMTVKQADSRNLATVIAAMRKLREAIVASARVDGFALSVYIFIIHATILTGHMESYHPALLHLLRKILPAHDSAITSGTEPRVFLGFYILDLACRQDDLGRAYHVAHAHGYRDERVKSLLKAIVRDDWCMYWRQQEGMDRYQKRLCQWRDERMMIHALNCLGSSYLSVEKEYVEMVTRQEWTSKKLKDSKPTWELEGDLIIMKRIRKK